MAKLQVATAIYSYLARIYDVKHRVVYLHLQGGGLKHNQEHRAMHDITCIKIPGRAV